jgi:acyl-coenzyme A thioesterase PaaI-like protein
MREWLTRRLGKARLLRWIMTLYPPYFGAGVRVRHISADFREVRVAMGLGWYNRNYVGTQFGGSLYSMVDPFFMLMLMENLGREYIVWDKAAVIDFISPGKGPVFARFSIDEPLLDEIRQQTAHGDKYLPQLQVEIHDGAGTLVARVDKTLYVRLKPQARQA